MKAKHKVLCFLIEDWGRDPEMLLPLIYFAEKYCNCEVRFEFTWNIYSIYQKQPDVVLLPNTVGLNLFFEASKYAHQQGIKVFALISEGNFRIDGSSDFWGFNIEKIFYQDFVCCWSQRSCEFLKTKLPDIKDKIVFTGATGFDRYTIYNFISKEEYLTKKNLTQYKKIIGYAGWAFGKLGNKQGLEELKFFFNYDPEKLVWVEKQMYLVESILKEAIEKNPEILFILKKHPSEVNQSIVAECLNEMSRLSNYPNVLYIKEGENLHDLINISDLWLGFETTTALEAWLLNKNTILINPDPNFKRDMNFKGSVIAQDYFSLQKLIDEYYNTKKINKFNEPEHSFYRNKAIEDTIGYSDGFNHLRAGYYFKQTVDLIEKNGLNKKRIFSTKYFIKHLLMVVGRFFYIKRIFIHLPKFKKTIWIFENYKLKNIISLKLKYYSYIDEFYKKHNIEESIKNNTIWDKIFRS